MELQEAKGSTRLSVKVLLSYRAIILLFSAMLLASRQPAGPGPGLDWVAIAAYGIYNGIAMLFYIPVMSSGARLAFCLADILAACLAAFLSGGVDSPLIFCFFISLFSLHCLYGIKGLIYGILSASLGVMGVLLTDRGALIREMPLGAGAGKIVYMALASALLYAVPYLVVKRYYRDSFRIRELEQELDDLDDTNSRLIVLCEMTGSLSLESGISHNMDKILMAVSELFEAERASIFVNHKGEVSVFGNPTQEEVTEIYKLMTSHITGSEDRSDNLPKGEGITLIPIIRGVNLKGVLSLYRRKTAGLTEREAVLLSVAANIISTYLENADYAGSLMFQPETSIQINKLDSGKAVKGIVDKRILSSP
ncbi:MAG TPA: hypothetical protein PK830_06255 [Candidatus Atribacteria bacterium]|nr:hypothetical protein [Candidatus Atribacteria bacterium]HPT78686.1 hypothetical protein [Candidatus Atribacteria bacterium]